MYIAGSTVARGAPTALSSGTCFVCPNCTTQNLRGKRNSGFGSLWMVYAGCMPGCRGMRSRLRINAQRDSDLLLTPCAVLYRNGQNSIIRAQATRCSGAVFRHSHRRAQSKCMSEGGHGFRILGGALVKVVQVDLREHTGMGQAKSVVTRRGKAACSSAQKQSCSWACMLGATARAPSE